MIYLMSQVTFIFLTLLYYKMNFITSSQTMVFIKYFPRIFRISFIDCFWRTIFCSTQKYVSKNVCKTCLKELGILKMQGNLWKILAACNFSKNPVLKSKSCEISSIDTYVCEDLEFIMWCIPLDHEIYTKYKKVKNITLSNFIKVIYNYNLCHGIKSIHAKN